jgi:hypothetical protein
MITGTFSADLQRAVYQLLSTYPGMPLVYDDVPRGDAVAFPYVAIGEDTHVPWDTYDFVGAESTLTIHVWSRERGMKQAKEIQALLYEALHRKTLALDQFDLINLEFDFQDTFQDPDGLTRHGVSRFRTMVEQHA